MNRLPYLLAVVLVVMAPSVVVACAEDGPEKPKTTQAEPVDAVAEPATTEKTVEQDDTKLAPGSAGQVAHIDPKTGKFVAAPTAPQPEAGIMERAATQMSFEGLEEVQSPVPGGGVIVDLKGRFRIPLVATVDENGQVTVDCGSKPSDPEEEE